METKLIQCAVCGAEIDQVTMQCPYCVAPPPEPAPPPIVPVLTPAAASDATPTTNRTEAAVPAAAAPAAGAAPSAPTPPVAATDRGSGGDRERGLALFEAEECLARGA